MPEEAADFDAILRVLQEHGVAYILVGGVCAVLHGAPVTTFDLDIVHRRDPDNITRLMAALRALDSYYWEHATRRLEPEARALALPGHHLLATRYGRLDLLGTISGGLGYDELLPRTTKIEVDPGLTVTMIDLKTLIEAKEWMGREKDRLVLPILRRTLEEIERAQNRPE